MKINEALQSLVQPLYSLQPDPTNARDHNDTSYTAIMESYVAFGQQKPIVGVREADGKVTVIDGNGQLEAARRLGWDGMAVVVFDNPSKAKQYALAINRIAELSSWNPQRLAVALEAIHTDFGDSGFVGTGFTAEDFKVFQDNKDVAEGGEGKSYMDGDVKRRLKDRFLLPPFSILDTRSAVWQERRASWLALGLKSEVGRKEGLAFHVKEFDTDTSVFDPVLCELVYRWFLPDGTKGEPLTVLDPMCGGSVRGVVAAALGVDYTGVDLRAEQIGANRKQWIDIRKVLGHTSLQRLQDDAPVIYDASAVTPIVRNPETGVYLKRDDTLSVGGVRGTKARACYAEMSLHSEAAGFTMAASRHMPALPIVAAVAKHVGKPIRIHAAKGALTPGVDMAQKCGAEIVVHDKGLANALSVTASQDALTRQWHYVQWGFQTTLTVKTIADQLLPLSMVRDPGIKRIVVAVDSGMLLCGILHGLARYSALDDLSVLAVVVGKDPTKRIDAFAPNGWRKRVKLVQSGSAYDTPSPVSRYGSAPLDPYREGKCVEHLQEGDLLWVGGENQTELDHTDSLTGDVPTPTWYQGDATSLPEAVTGQKYDLVFTCPPYGDLEVYSHDEADLSYMSQEEFVKAWGRVIANAAACLKDGRFAVVVIGDYRDKKTGFYQNFQGVTVAAFEAVGMRLYNEAILVNSAGTLGFRIGPQWPWRKMGRQHQTVLVFIKGDPKGLPVDFKNTNGMAEAG